MSMNLCEAVMIAGVMLIGLRYVQMKHLFDKYEFLRELRFDNYPMIESFIRDAGIPVGIAFFVLWLLLAFSGRC